MYPHDVIEGHWEDYGYEPSLRRVRLRNRLIDVLLWAVSALLRKIHDLNARAEFDISILEEG